MKYIYAVLQHTAALGIGNKKRRELKKGSKRSNIKTTTCHA